MQQPHYPSCRPRQRVVGFQRLINAGWHRLWAICPTPGPPRSHPSNAASKAARTLSVGVYSVAMDLILAGAAVLVAAVIALLVFSGGGGAGKSIPNPFPFWSDLVLEVSRTGGFPGGRVCDTLTTTCAPACHLPGGQQARQCRRRCHPAPTHADMVKLHAQHGPIFWWRFLGRRMLMVATHDACKKVLMSEGTYGERRRSSCTWTDVPRAAACCASCEACGCVSALTCLPPLQSRLTTPRA